jgi:uncharacterized protein YndB with AHSA1/START domain
MDRSVTGPAEREIVLTRVFDVPSELVWKAWTKPNRLAEWWGPKGFQIPFASWTPRSVADLLANVEPQG